MVSSPQTSYLSKKITTFIKRQQENKKLTSNLHSGFQRKLLLLSTFYFILLHYSFISHDVRNSVSLLTHTTEFFRYNWNTVCSSLGIFCKESFLISAFTIENHPLMQLRKGPWCFYLSLLVSLLKFRCGWLLL